jgi:hypothetical protein
VGRLPLVRGRARRTLARLATSVTAVGLVRARRDRYTIVTLLMRQASSTDWVIGALVAVALPCLASSPPLGTVYARVANERRIFPTHST